ncbi:MAG: TVP38/TMEM64 family protein [bacterium]
MKEHKIGAAQNPNPKRTGGKIKALIFLAVIIALFLIGRFTGVGERLKNLQEWINQFGLWAPVVYVLLYTAVTLAAGPGWILTVLAGSIFGSVVGTIVVSAGSVLGASLAFLVARYFLRSVVADWISGKEQFRKLDAMTEKHGAIIVAITRLIPIFPFNLLNFGFGLTRVPFWTYVGWSWLCMLPGTILYVVGADAVTTAISRKEIPWSLVIVVTAVLAILVAIGNHARKILKDKEKENHA